MAPPVRVNGLKDLQRSLREMGKEWPKELRVANKAAAEVVVEQARRTAQTLGGVHRKSASSIRALAQQRSASVKIGGDRYPFALGAEFGSVRYKQFPEWRGSGGGAGYFLYPAIRSENDRVVETYAELIDRLTARAFPD